MGSSWKDHQGHTLSNVLQTLQTFSVGAITGGARVVNISMITKGGTIRTVDIYLIPTGQVAADAYLIYRGPTLANDTIAVPGGPFIGSGGAYIQAKQDAGTDVTVRVSSLEET